MKITAELLQEFGACQSTLQEFKRFWPNGCWPTVENLTIASARGLDYTFLDRLLPPLLQGKFDDWIDEDIHTPNMFVLASEEDYAAAEAVDLAQLSAALMETPRLKEK